jgi:hypothetical protein
MISGYGYACAHRSQLFSYACKGVWVGCWSFLALLAYGIGYLLHRGYGYGMVGLAGRRGTVAIIPFYVCFFSVLFGGHRVCAVYGKDIIRNDDHMGVNAV